MSDLIITNGDTAAELLAASGLEGRIVPWRDILHEGPLLPSSTLRTFSDLRARYLSARFGMPYSDARADFLIRDAFIEAHELFDRIAIWLEHDLYDQLQLLQILHFFDRERRAEGVIVVQANDFIGTQTPETILRFVDRSFPLTPDLARAAALVWNAILAPTPEPLVARLDGLPKELPFLRPALLRFLEELPGAKDGLSRSERSLLAAVRPGGITPQAAFEALIASEEAAFMGDGTAYRLLDDLALAGAPLIEGIELPFPTRDNGRERARYLAAPLALTALGRAILDGRPDGLAERGIDRWWGGTHMTGHDSWRWDGSARTLIPPGG